MTLKEKLRNTSYFINSKGDCYFWCYICLDNFVGVMFGKPKQFPDTSITYFYDYK